MSRGIFLLQWVFMQILPYAYSNPNWEFFAFFSKTVTLRYIQYGYKWKSIKFSTKKLYAIISPFSTIKQQITFKKSKNRFLAVFLHFSQKIVISRYKRHGYQMKELKILYKKGLCDHVAILSHQAANRVWKFQKSIFVGFFAFFSKNRHIKV